MAEKKKLTIRILSQEFPILVENEKIASEISEYINTLINRLSKTLVDQPIQTVLIMSCLNAAYELLIEKEKSSTLSETVSKLECELAEIKQLLTSVESVSSPNDPPIDFGFLTTE